MHKGLQILTFSFDEPHLTHFGGMVLIQRFCKQLHLRRRLQRMIRLSQRQGDYQFASLILALLFVIIAGLRRLNKTDVLQYNGTFLALLGLKKFPDQTTLRRFLKRLSPATIRQIVRVHDQLRRDLFALPQPTSSLIFDIDSVVLTLYGRQQGARIGYNPRKHGRRSYHPLLCFEASRQEFWHGSLRPGDAASKSGVNTFLKRCLTKVPSTIARSRIRIRADAGYFSGKFVKFIEKQGLGYVIDAREYRGIKQQAQAARFRKLHFGWEAGEFLYTPTHWKKPYRFVVIRRPMPDDPVEAKQLTLFTFKRYAYTVFVTNLKLAPWRVWRFLQSARHHRKKHSRTAVRFADGQNSHRRLVGQRCLLSAGAAGLQYCALVQATVFAAGVFVRDAGNAAHRSAGSAGSIDAPGWPQHLASAAGLPSAQAVRGHVSENQSSESSQT